MPKKVGGGGGYTKKHGKCMCKVINKWGIGTANDQPVPPFSPGGSFGVPSQCTKRDSEP